MKESIVPAYPDLVPVALRAEWRERGLYPGVPVFDLFRQQAAARPDAVAVFDDSGETTYGELLDASLRLAAGLRGLGVRAGQTVASQLPNSWQAVAVDLAVAALGAIVLPFPAGRGDQDIRALLTRSRAAALIVPARYQDVDPVSVATALLPELPTRVQLIAQGGGPDCRTAARFEDLLGHDPLAEHDLPEVHADDVVRLLVSSGTESEPKVVAYSHNTLVGGRGRFLARLQVEGRPMRAMYLMPLGSSFGSGAVFCVLAGLGGSLVLRRRFEAGAALAAIDRCRPTHLLGVPTMFQHMVAHPALGSTDTSSVECVITGGALIDAATARRCTDHLGRRLVSLYGSADGVNCHTGVDDPPEISRETLGRPDPDICAIRILDEDGRELPQGEPGEIVALGPMTPLCYVDAPELNERYRLPGGWVRTGDRGWIDTEGRLRMAGRKKDIIIRGGGNISPAQLEGLIAGHPEMLGVACVAVPDQVLGQRVCACLVPTGERAPTLTELTGFLRAGGLEPHKLPEYLLVLDELPLGAAGKVDKRALAGLAERHFARLGGPGRPNGVVLGGERDLRARSAAVGVTGAGARSWGAAPVGSSGAVAAPVGLSGIDSRAGAPDGSPGAGPRGTAPAKPSGVGSRGMASSGSPGAGLRVMASTGSSGVGSKATVSAGSSGTDSRGTASASSSGTDSPATASIGSSSTDPRESASTTSSATDSPATASTGSPSTDPRETVSTTSSVTDPQATAPIASPSTDPRATAPDRSSLTGSLGMTAAHPSGITASRVTESPHPARPIAELAAAVRDFVEQEVIPAEPVLQGDGPDARRLLLELRARAREAGLWGLGFPVAVGGPGPALADYLLIAEQEGRSEYGPPVLGGETIVDVRMLRAHGSPRLQEEYVGPLVRGELTVSFGMTEPDRAGSQPQAVATRAVREGDGWSVTGRKWFISNAGFADCTVTMARTENGLSALLIPTSAPGYRKVRPLKVYGRDTGQWEIELDRVHVPGYLLLGREGEGLTVAGERLGLGRTLRSMHWLGAAQRAFDLMCRRLREREVHGGLLSERQLMREHVFLSYSQISAARDLTLRAAQALDQGRDARVEVAAAKVAASRAANDVADRAVQVFGAEGLSDDQPLSAMARRLRTTRILDGPDEVHITSAASRLLQTFASAPSFDFTHSGSGPLPSGTDPTHPVSALDHLLEATAP
ncbi:AMP-binding protein [Streptomyces sp. NPDC004610]|uniref:AMP-binding protein n=1 Tax=unclassified Streptomyces TaxID=2593676 RepID=UPI0033A16A7F